MLKILRSDSANPDFVKLVKQLDAELAHRDGKDHSFYDQFNKIDMIKHAVVVYENYSVVGCGAMKSFDSDSMEIKRMYTLPEFRGRGIAIMVLAELENWAKELSIKKCVLETGKKQPEAIQLYKKNGYKQISNYGQYTGIPNSVCFSKELM